MPTTFTTGQVAKYFDVPVWQLLQTIKRGFLPEPGRGGIYRVWVEADLPAVRAALIAAGYLRAEKEVASAI
jgi:hypothetical protein